MADLKPKVKSASGYSTEGLLRFVEPATLLTLMIGAVYYIGWLYLDGYFSRVGINHLSLELPTTYYLKQGYLSATAFLILLNFFEGSKEEINKKRKKGEPFTTHLLLLALIVILFLPYPKISRSATINSGIALVGALLILTILTLQKRSIVEVWFAGPWIRRLFIILMIFSLLGLHANTAGQMQGKKDVEGSAFSITFTWKDGTPTEIDGKELLLILHNNQTYYVVEKSQPAPDHPRVFIIPDEKVTYAVTSANN